MQRAPRPALIYLSGLALLGITLFASGAGAGALPGAECCDPAREPILDDTQHCATGYSCCGNGEWHCNDESGLSTCETAGVSCEVCCDATGESTCSPEIPPCETGLCCNPEAEPGRFGNPACAEGARCCGTGEWSCDLDGESTCATDSLACADCCEPGQEPGRYGNLSCEHGATCCADGGWICNADDGSTECRPGASCERCCDLTLQPGRGDNLACPDGQAGSCCTDGGWECADPAIGPICNPAGESCPRTCCDLATRPTDWDDAEGAVCCSDGTWLPDNGDGTANCETGEICEQCCDPLRKPGSGGDPACENGATCCSTGGWQCNDPAGIATCDLSGPTCEGCCLWLTEPGRGDNPPCPTGATCCDDGSWACNDEHGSSTCELASTVCGLQCCTAASEPNQPGTPTCETGYRCCTGERWECNDESGGATCTASSCETSCDTGDPDTCDDGEFCQLRFAECGATAGSCTRWDGISCSFVSDPVCGCDGVTYFNSCWARIHQASVRHPGTCESREIPWIYAAPGQTFYWPPQPYANSYNIYGRLLDHLPWICLKSGIAVPEVSEIGNPLPGESWWLLVSAVFNEFEGPLGAPENAEVVSCPGPP